MYRYFSLIEEGGWRAWGELSLYTETSRQFAYPRRHIKGLFSFPLNFSLFPEKTIRRKKERSSSLTHLLFLRGLFFFSSNFYLFPEKTIRRKKERSSPQTHLLFLRGLFSFSSNFCLFPEKTIRRKKERSFFVGCRFYLFIYYLCYKTL